MAGETRWTGGSKRVKREHTQNNASAKEIRPEACEGPEIVFFSFSTESYDTSELQWDVVYLEQHC